VSTGLAGRQEVLAAAERINAQVLRTPVASRESLNESLGFELFFKCENLQRTGSFKFRGASNAIARLVEQSAAADEPPVVTTHSSGNHGAALALAATRAGLKSIVVVPRGANPLKRAAVERYGGEIVDCGETLAEREATLKQVVARHQAIFIPPYDHADIVAGQGTATLELVSEVGPLDQIWVPVGGGGLAGGALLAVSDRDTVIRGVEPELADDAYWSLREGSIQPQRPPQTVADGLRTALGKIPFAIFQQHQLSISLVSEAQILAAQKLVWQRLKLVVEPSGVVPLAGLLAAAESEPAAFQGGRFGVIFSGGNAQFPGI
jgi:threonine dehydratase